MIIWGTKYSNIDSRPVDKKCSHCNHNGLIQLTTQKFFTLFYIPTLPLKKYVSNVCPNCATEYQADAINMNAIIKSTEAKTPLWGYSGLVIVLVLLATGLFIEHDESKLRVEYLASPKAGDIIVVKAPDEYKDLDEYKTPYIFMKIKNVDGDNITVVFSKHMFSRQSNASKKAHAANEDSFNEEEILFTKEEFQKLNILSIERK